MKRATTFLLELACTAGLLVGMNKVTAATQIEVVPATPTDAAAAHYTPNRAPLEPAAFMRLPLGSIAPAGWLKHQLDLMADGQCGHLEELSHFLAPDSGWLGGENDGWEEAAYWLRGFYDLAQITGDPRLKERALFWIHAVIESQDDDGYYGADANRMVVGKDGKKLVDLWPHMVMNDALISHYEATGDERVIPMLTRFFAFCRDLPDDLFLPVMPWDYYERYGKHFGDWRPKIQMKRAGDFMPQILWLYNRTGEPWLIDLAVEVFHRSQPPVLEFIDRHTVNFAQRFRYAAQMYPITGDESYLRRSELFYDSFMAIWGQMPRGAHAADEGIRSGRMDPRQAIETCSLAELNKSHYILSRITGEVKYGDRIEDITLNHLPASHAPDHRSLRYLTACNMAYSVPVMDFRNRGNHPVFGADLHRCCQHNSSMAWPRFARNLWQATGDGGLIAWLYAPCSVTADVGSPKTRATIHCDTDYPFRETVALTIETPQPVAFPLYLRVPGWCERIDVDAAGQKQSINDAAGRLVRIDRTWTDGDRVALRLPMPIRATRWPRNSAVTIDRGPLSYSVRIKERWEGNEKAKWPRWTIRPDSPWNYGLAIDPDDPGADIRVTTTDEIAPQPWQESTAPVVLHVPARRIADWKASVDHTVDPVRRGPVRSDEPLETIEMIPLGCAHLRMSVLPLITDRRDARPWSEIRDPHQ